MTADPREPARRELLKDVSQDRIWRYVEKKNDDGTVTVEKKTDGLRAGGGIWGTEAEINGDPCGGPRSTPSWKMQKLFKCFPVFCYPAGSAGFDNDFSNERPPYARSNERPFDFHNGTDIGRAGCDTPRIRAPLDGFVLQTPAGVESRLARRVTRGGRCIHCLDRQRDGLSGRGGNYVYLLCRPDGFDLGSDEYLRIIFTHLASESPLVEGTFCRAGQEIGVMGNSGGRSSGSGNVHLHIQCNLWKLLRREAGFAQGDRKGRLIGKVKDPVDLYAALLWTRFMPAEESGYTLPSDTTSLPLDTPLPEWAQELMSISEWCPGEEPQEQEQDDGVEEMDAAAGAEAVLSTGRRYRLFTETLRDPSEYLDYEEQGSLFPESER